MKILAIETSCDETAIALVEAKGGINNFEFEIIKSSVASQIKLHSKFGGVVPNLAKREHIKNLPILLNKTFPEIKKNKQIPKIDLIAVTVGPGLEPALWTGVQFAKELSDKWRKPVVGVNHLDGHLYSFLLSEKFEDKKYLNKNSKKIKNKKYKIKDKSNLFPAISLIVSGGHTILAELKSFKEYKKLGETLDDAIGESFDKVARLLNLPYPGGPELERMAKRGDKKSIPFPSPMINQKNYNFSYSGLKTSVLYYLKNIGSTVNDFSLSNKEKNDLKKIESKENLRANIAASFQYSAFNSVVKKTLRAVQEKKAKLIVVGGGVAANKNLHDFFVSEIEKNKLKTDLIFPPLEYCMDNGVMIALAAYINKLKNKEYPLEANGNLNI